MKCMFEHKIEFILMTLSVTNAVYFYNRLFAFVASCFTALTSADSVLAAGLSSLASTALLRRSIACGGYSFFVAPRGRPLLLESKD